MVLGKLPVSGLPTIWMIVEQEPSALAVGGGGGCLDVFTLIYLFSSLSPSLWETARYRLKYCLKGLLNPKQLTNLPTAHCLLSTVFFSRSVHCKTDCDIACAWWVPRSSAFTILSRGRALKRQSRLQQTTFINTCSLLLFFFFQKKIRLDISVESSA